MKQKVVFVREERIELLLEAGDKFIDLDVIPILATDFGVGSMIDNYIKEDAGCIQRHKEGEWTLLVEESEGPISPAKEPPKRRGRPPKKA